jgi:hypothetical protein
MKAAYYTGNQNFTIESVTPIAPRGGEVQVKVAYYIDDSLFLMATNNIHKNPFDFYGFTANWYGFSQKMAAIN